MAHLWTLPAAALLLAAPLNAQAPLSTQAPVSMVNPTVDMAIDARIDMLHGRAVLVGGGAQTQTLRRSETKLAAGPSHFEVSAGAQARISWLGTMSVDVYGPAIMEWRTEGDAIRVVFEQLTWADFETRSGQHTVDLPSNWRATCARSSFSLRGIAGGPSELRLNAGTPVRVDWQGPSNQMRPPVTVYPGSSVRLDTPRHAPMEPSIADGSRAGSPWASQPASGETSWPYRDRADTDVQVAERGTLSRETNRLNEMPGIPNGEVTRIRTYEQDGTSNVRPIVGNGAVTSSQVSVAPSTKPNVEVTERPSLSDGRATLPRREESAPPARRVSPMSVAKAPQVAPSANQASSAPEATSVPQAAAGFVLADWRNVAQASLNGAGVVAAEKAPGVEVRILGAGRTKVFVSSGSTKARWCFTPWSDYLMHPGAVAVFEADGSLRMSFGTTEKYRVPESRPSFSDLPQ